MGKKGPNARVGGSGSGGVTFGSITPQQKPKGKKQSHVNGKLMMKLEHIKDLAVWASGEASIPSLGAFFSHRLAASSEALGLPPDLSLLSCQRCESVLQPSFNCTVRVEKSDAKARRRNKKSRNNPQNFVVYNCHFCSHRNLKRGTARGYLKEICAPKDKLSSKVEHPKSSTIKSSEPKTIAASNDSDKKIDIGTSPEIARGDHIAPADDPSTPSLRMDISLLDSRRKRRNKSGLKKPSESESISATATDVDKAVGTTNKRKRKSWVSLKEIAESSELDKSKKFSNVFIHLAFADFSGSK